MRVYLVNDCYIENSHRAWHHFGCKARIDSISARIEAADHKIIHICKKPNGPTLDKILDTDIMIINGEGTFRDEAIGWEPGRIEALKNGILEAKRQKKKVYLFNATWCNMKSGWGDILKQLDGISVREMISYKEMFETTGAVPDLHIDELYFCPLNGSGINLTDKEVIGEIYPQNTTDRLTIDHPYFKNMARLSFLEHDWSYIVNSLHNAKLYISGQHDGIYAACKAKVPFIPIKVNTHKIIGLFKWAGVEIPIATNLEDVKRNIDWAYSHPETYSRLFNWMEKQLPWPIPQK